MVQSGMSIVRSKPGEEQVQMVYLRQGNIYHDPNIPPLELYVPSSNSLELPSGTNFTTIDNKVYCENIPHRIGLPRTMGIEVSASIPIFGVLASPANLSGTMGDVILVIPRCGFSLYTSNTSGSIMVDGTIITRDKKSKYDDSPSSRLIRLKADLYRRAHSPQLLNNADGISAQFDRRVLSDVSELEVCLADKVISISRTSGSICLYQANLNLPEPSKDEARVISIASRKKRFGLF